MNSFLQKWMNNTTGGFFSELGLEVGAFGLPETVPASESPTEPEDLQDPDRAESGPLAALNLLNKSGVRIMLLGRRYVLGIWRELDCEELRSAIRALRLTALPVRYLDDPEVPEKYRRYPSQRC